MPVSRLSCPKCNASWDVSAGAFCARCGEKCAAALAGGRKARPDKWTRRPAIVFAVGGLLLVGLVLGAIRLNSELVWYRYGQEQKRKVEESLTLANFMAIKPGMTARDVTKIMPAQTHTVGNSLSSHLVWQWSADDGRRITVTFRNPRSGHPDGDAIVEEVTQANLK